MLIFLDNNTIKTLLITKPSCPIHPIHYTLGTTIQSSGTATSSTWCCQLLASMCTLRDRSDQRNSSNCMSTLIMYLKMHYRRLHTELFNSETIHIVTNIFLLRSSTWLCHAADCCPMRDARAALVTGPAGHVGRLDQLLSMLPT